MRVRKSSIIAAAVLSATPMLGKAATITYSYESLGYTTDTTNDGLQTFTPLVPVFNAVANTDTLTIPVGSILSLAVQVSVSGSTTPTSVTTGWGANATNLAKIPQNLGMALFGYGFNTSSQTLLPWDGSGVAPYQVGSGVVVNSNFNTGTNAGGDNPTPNGSIKGNTISGATAYTSAQSGSVSAFSWGANGTPADLFSQVWFDAPAAGQATLTPLIGSQSYYVYVSGGVTTTSTKSGPVYASHAVTAADTINALPSLIVNIGATSSTTTTPSSHSIISLAPGGTGTYGNQLGSITLTGAGNGSYTPGATAFGAATTGYVVTSAFNPITDSEVYAIKLEYNSGSGEVVIPTSSSLNTTIVNDIKAGTGYATSNVSAGTVSGSAYAALFPGYAILLVSTAGFTANGSGAADLDVDFSQDTDTNTPGLVVIGAAAVPEPATAAGLVLGAAGLLLGRRKSRVATA